MLFKCKHCRERVSIYRVRKNPNNKVAVLRRLWDAINRSPVLKLQPNVRLCPHCSRELLAWATRGTPVRTTSPMCRASC